MSRRQGGSARRFVDSGIPFSGALHSKSRSSPLVSACFILLGGFLLICYAYGGSVLYVLLLLSFRMTCGLFGSNNAAVNKIEGDFSCTLEVQRAIPVLKKAYGDSMRKVLHIGPDSCSLVSQLLKEEETEAWGVEPYDIEDAEGNCKNLVHKGIVRVADIKFPLPYRAKSFSLVIISDALDYLSPKYLNKTLPELARLADGLVIFAGYPGQETAKVSELPKFGRPAKMRSSSWWAHYFLQNSLEENESGSKKFEQAASETSYKPSCQVFHLNSFY